MPVLVALIVVLLLIALGVGVIGAALELLWLALVGLVIGGLARLIVPGQQAISGFATALYGIAGALLGGIIADIADVGWFPELLIAILVAAVLVALFAGSTGPRDRVNS